MNLWYTFPSSLMRGVVRRRSLRRSKEWRPAATARTAPREARDPVPPGFGPAADRPMRRSGATAGTASAGPRPKIATVEQIQNFGGALWTFLDSRKRLAQR